MATSETQAHYERLGLTTGASPEAVRTAYHAKLREFPAHTYPQEFKAIRRAYEALRRANTFEDFFKPAPVEAVLDPEQLAQLRQRSRAAVEVSLADLIRLTF
jgi:curved DNA-binding protein CbpA